LLDTILESEEQDADDWNVKDEPRRESTFNYSQTDKAWEGSGQDRKSIISISSKTISSKKVVSMAEFTYPSRLSITSVQKSEMIPSRLLDGK